MPDRYEPPTDPMLWATMQQARPVPPSCYGPPQQPPGPDQLARAAGLRRMSRLTWRATQLSAIAAVGFATLFARTAHAQPVSSQSTPKPAAAKAKPSPTKTHKRRHHHRKPHPAAAPQPANSPSAAAPSLAPPSAAPAPPPPPPSPVQTQSSGSAGGGGG